MIPKQIMTKFDVNPSLCKTLNAIPNNILGARVSNALIKEKNKLRVTNLGLRQRKLKYQWVADLYRSVGNLNSFALWGNIGAV